MANLSNINNKLILTDGGNVLIGQTGAIGSPKLQVDGGATFMGSVSVGVTGAVTDRRFQVTSGTYSSLTATTNQYGVVINPTYASNITNSIYNLYNGPALASGTTLTNLYNLYLEGNGISGSTVTNSYGVYQSGGGDKNYFAGNVGIGETNPTYKFEVRGSGTNTLQRWTTTEGGALLLIPANDAANPDWTFIAGTNEDIQIDPANNDSGLIVKYNGNVGIGTDNPQSKLHVKSSESGASAPWTNADNLVIEDSGNAGLAFQTPNTGAATIAFQDPESVQAGFIQYLHADNALRFATNGNNERMRIDSSGNLLLNQATSRIKGGGSTTGRLELSNSDSKSYMMITGSTNTNPNLIYFVNDAAVTLTLNQDNSATFAGNQVTVDPASGDAILQLQSSTQTLRIDQNSIRTGTNNNLALFTNGNSNQLVLKQSNGYVGIGTNSPDYILTTQGSGVQRLKVVATDPSQHSAGVYFQVKNGASQVGTGTIATQNNGDMDFYTGSSSESFRMTILAGGNVGIGTTGPDAKLDVNGALKAQRFFSRNGSFSSTAGNWHNVVDLQQSEYENRTLICSVYTNGTHSYSSATVNVAYNGGSFVLTLGNKISGGSTDIRVSGGYLQYYTPWTSTTNFWRITIN